MCGSSDLKRTVETALFNNGKEHDPVLAAALEAQIVRGLVAAGFCFTPEAARYEAVELRRGFIDGAHRYCGDCEMVIIDRGNCVGLIFNMIPRTPFIEADVD